MLVVSEQDVTLLLSKRSPLFGRELGLEADVETCELVLLVFFLPVDDVLQKRGDHLLAGPHGPGLQNGWPDCLNLGDLVFFDQLAQADVHKLVVLLLAEESVLASHEYPADHGVLDQATDGLATCRHAVLLVSGHQVVGLRECLVALRQMQVHLITIEVSIVGVAVCVVHPDSLLLRQHSAPVSHDARLVQRRLSVNQQWIPVGEMPIDYLAPDGQQLR